MGASPVFADPPRHAPAYGYDKKECDRACIGHTLVLGRAGGVAQRGHHYHFTPRGDVRGGCRYATLVVDGRGPHEVLACPAGRGE